MSTSIMRPKAIAVATRMGRMNCKLECCSKSDYQLLTSPDTAPKAMSKSASQGAAPTRTARLNPAHQQPAESQVKRSTATPTQELSRCLYRCIVSGEAYNY